MDEKLVKLLGLWYVRNMDKVLYEELVHFIDLVFVDSNLVVDFITYLEYFKANRFTMNLLRENNQNGQLGETIRMLANTINDVKDFLGEEFLNIQNSLLQKLQEQYNMGALHSVYEEIIEEKIIANAKNRG